MIKKKYKPKKPVRIVDQYSETVLEDENISIEELYNKYPNGTIHPEIYISDPCIGVKFFYTETDSEYAERMARYETELKEYNDWWNTNKDLIEEQERKRKESHKKGIETKIKNLQKEIERLKNL